jgi:hypothetical protein
MVEHIKGLAECGVLNVPELEQLYRTNVERIMSLPAARAT